MSSKKNKYGASSSRQIRRKARHETESDLKECMSAATERKNIIGAESTSSSVESDTFDVDLQSLSFEDNQETDLNILTDNTPRECTVPIANKSSYNEANMVSIPPVENYEADTNNELNISLEDEDSYYRYSDSDADSIPDTDNEDDDINIDHHLNEDQLRDQEFKKDVVHWALDYKINHNALKGLLVLLNKHSETTFPKDP